MIAEILKQLERVSLYELPILVNKLYSQNTYDEEENERNIKDGIIIKFRYKDCGTGEEREHSIEFSNLEEALIEILRLASIYGNTFIKPIVEIYKEGKLIDRREFCDMNINSIAELLKERIRKLINGG